MKEIKEQGAQGDVLFLRVDRIPEAAKDVTAIERSGGVLILSHSETGHHHAIDNPEVKMFREPGDPMIAYLQIEGVGAEVVHHRSFDTHETIKLPAGLWQVRRQREYTPEGWRRVED